MTLPDEVAKAFKSLPFYLLGAIVFVPLVGALFTAGESLGLYVLYFVSPVFALGISLACGLGVWIMRQFIRAAVFAIERN